LKKVILKIDELPSAEETDVNDEELDYGDKKI
jgi:hypothetical protein